MFSKNFAIASFTMRKKFCINVAPNPSPRARRVNRAKEGAMTAKKFTDLPDYQIVARRRRETARKIKAEVLRRVRNLASPEALEMVARLLEELQQFAV